MPRPTKASDDPTALRNPVSCLVDDSDKEMITRVMKRYGVSKSDAVRMLLRAGAAEHDPSPPQS